MEDFNLKGNKIEEAVGTKGLHDVTINVDNIETESVLKVPYSNIDLTSLNILTGLRIQEDDLRAGYMLDIDLDSLSKHTIQLNAVEDLKLEPDQIGTLKEALVLYELNKLDSIDSIPRIYGLKAIYDGEAFKFCPIMQKVGEGNLAEYLKENTNTDTKNLLNSFKSLGGDLDLINKKLIHRDIKPENIVVDQSVDGKIKLTLVDFASAYIIKTSIPLLEVLNSSVHDASISQGYSAPEAVAYAYGDSDEVPIPTNSADIYSMAAVLRNVIGPEKHIPILNEQVWEITNDRPVNLHLRLVNAVINSLNRPY